MRGFPSTSTISREKSTGFALAILPPTPKASATSASSLRLSSSRPPLKKIFTCSYPLKSSSHLTSSTMRLKFPLLELGVSSLTALSLSPRASAAITASNFSSQRVSTRAVLGTSGGMISSKYFQAFT